MGRHTSLLPALLALLLCAQLSDAARAYAERPIVARPTGGGEAAAVAALVRDAAARRPSPAPVNYHNDAPLIGKDPGRPAPRRRRRSPPGRR